MLKRKVVLVSLVCLSLLLSISVPSAKATETFTLGAISSDADGLQSKTAIAQIAMEDLNTYFDPMYHFDIQVKNAQGDPSIHTQKVQEFHDAGVIFINGGGWSSQAANSLPYINANDVLLLSPSSTSPSLEFDDDNLFRLCPSDSYSAPAVAHMIETYGYTHVVIISRDDAWGNGMVERFTPEFELLGGTIVSGSPIRYSTSATDFKTYLAKAESQMKTAQKKVSSEKICVLLIAFNEAAQIITQAGKYPNIYNTKWFGTDGTASNWYILNQAPVQASHLRLFSTLPIETRGTRWDEVASRYTELTGEQFGLYNAYDYDIYWVYALSIHYGLIDVPNSADFQTVKSQIPFVASLYEGVSGNCALNDYGDRLNPGFNIWGYGTNNWATEIFWFGNINPENNVYWDNTASRLYGYASGSVTGYKDVYSAKIVKGNWDLTIDQWNTHFTLTYSEKNLNSAIEDSPVGSVDNFYVEGWGDIVSQTSSEVVIDCGLHFQKDWAKKDGTRQTVYFDIPAKITVSKSSIYIDLFTSPGQQNFDILGKTTSFKFY